MGWSSGSYIAERLWDELKPLLDEKYLSKLLYETFAEYDADGYEWEEGSLEYTYYKLNKPKEFEELNDEH